MCVISIKYDVITQLVIKFSNINHDYYNECSFIRIEPHSEHIHPGLIVYHNAQSSEHGEGIGQVLKYCKLAIYSRSLNNFLITIMARELTEQ